jgi:phosphohistidine swiveling domain-containing protein
MSGTAEASFVVGWDDPNDATYTWHKQWGGVLPPLHQDVARTYAEANKRCWDACGSPMAREHILIIVNGWAYGRGPDMSPESMARLKTLSDEVQRYPTAKGKSWYERVLRPEVVATIAPLLQHPPRSHPLKELVAHFEACNEAHAHVMGDLHWRLAAAGISTMQGPPTYDWPQTYAEITGRDEAEASVLVGGSGTELSQLVRMLRDLARTAASEPALLAAIERNDVAALSAHAGFRPRFRGMLNRYGHRTGNGWGSNVNSLMAPTWNIAPELPLQLIAMYARSDIDSLDARDDAGADARRRIMHEIRLAMRSDPERRERFEAALDKAKYDMWVMEDHNDWMDQASIGIVRDSAYRVGEHLVQTGVIDHPDDVMHLSIAELRDLPPNPRALIAERKAELVANAQLDAPEYIGADPSGPGSPFVSDEGEGLVGRQLRGVAASPGRYTGRARVFPPSPKLPDVEDGDILVAKDAGPDWTPLFAILGAVVLDVGAIWQHAAVMAREFGIPAVMGTKDATSAIKDGQTITVDGDAGVVDF